jgi:hypothetical protein
MKKFKNYENFEVGNQKDNNDSQNNNQAHLYAKIGVLLVLIIIFQIIYIICINSYLKEKNNELIDIYLSSTLQPNISNDDLLLLQNLLNFGEKYQINTLGMKLFNIGLCVISSIKLLLKCIKCNKVAFESFYQKISKNENLFYLGTKCPRCDNEIFSLFKSEFIHENNLDNAGIVYISGGGIIEFLPSTFSLTCLNCNEEKKVKLRTGGLHINDKNCRKCQKELLFFITNISFSITYISNM